ncbi:MAG: hypothetical protein ACREBW_07710 [Candidatus Micrarchaeaceae archaeon]
MALLLCSCAKSYDFHGLLYLRTEGQLATLGRVADSVFGAGGPPPSPFAALPARMAHLQFKVIHDTVLTGRLTAIDTIQRISESWRFTTREFMPCYFCKPPDGTFAGKLVPIGSVADSGFSFIMIVLNGNDSHGSFEGNFAWVAKGIDSIRLRPGAVPLSFYDLQLFSRPHK